MIRKPIGQRIAELEERRRSLVARLGKQERARQTRRRILVGMLVLDRLEQRSASSDPAFLQQLAQWLARELPGILTREGDLALFPDLFEPGNGGPTVIHHDDRTDHDETGEDR